MMYELMNRYSSSSTTTLVLICIASTTRVEIPILIE